MKRILSFVAVFCAAVTAQAQVRVSLHETAQDEPLIPAEIYGQFSEHLGKCIYEGIWVGPESDIPNTDGYRNDVLEALKTLKVPILRWPGGCFADEYHWMDGIGPRDKRPAILNSNWGGTMEDNSFGTHEFLNLCEMLDIEPYISGNVGSGTVEELAKWVEYMTADKGAMAQLRKANGREKPWKVKYLGIGNETWGCGGDMTADYYADVYKRYSLYARNYAGNSLFKVACGANSDDFQWTRTLMEKSASRMDGLSVHYYSVDNWNSKGKATQFTPEEYYDLLTKTVDIDRILTTHSEIMDLYDPERRVALFLDEWGTWFEVEEGTNPGWLFQQNTQRDAIVAALNLNIFNKHTRRLRGANIAQMVNVLQAMILTDGPKMVLTPTYHVFRMYNVHQDATAVPVDYKADILTSASGRQMETLSVSASRDAEGRLHVSVVNPLLEKSQTVQLSLDSLKPASVTGEILQAAHITDYNAFGRTPAVAPAPFKGIRIKGNTVSLTLPAASVIVLEIR